MWQKPSLLLTNWAKRPEEYSIILKGGKVAIEPAELLADRTRMTLWERGKYGKAPKKYGMHSHADCEWVRAWNENVKYVVDVQNARLQGTCKEMRVKITPETPSLLTQSTPRKMMKKEGVFQEKINNHAEVGPNTDVNTVLDSWNVGLMSGPPVIPGWCVVHGENCVLTQSTPRKSSEKVKKGPFWAVFRCYLDDKLTLCQSKYTVTCALTRCTWVISF